MFERVERDAPQHKGSGVAKAFGGPAVCGFVQGDGQQQGDDADDDGLDGVVAHAAGFLSIFSNTAMLSTWAVWGNILTAPAWVQA